MNVLVDIFRDIVAGVSKDVGYMVNYQFGDWQYTNSSRWTTRYLWH